MAKKTTTPAGMHNGWVNDCKPVGTKKKGKETFLASDFGHGKKQKLEMETVALGKIMAQNFGLAWLLSSTARSNDIIN